MDESATSSTCNNGGYIPPRNPPPPKPKKLGELIKTLPIPVNYSYSLTTDKLKRSNSLNAENDSLLKEQTIPYNIINCANFEEKIDDSDESLKHENVSNTNDLKDIEDVIRNKECVNHKPGSYIDGRANFRNPIHKSRTMKLQDLSMKQKRQIIEPKDSKCINTMATLCGDYLTNRDDEALHRQMKDCINKLPIKHVPNADLTSHQHYFETDDAEQPARTSRVRKPTTCRTAGIVPAPRTRSCSKSSNASSTFLESTTSKNKDKSKIAQLHEAYVRSINKKIELAKLPDNNCLKSCPQSPGKESNHSNNYLISGKLVSKDPCNMPLVSQNERDVGSTEGAPEHINTKLGKKALSLYRNDIRNLTSQLENFPVAPADNPDGYRGFQELNLDRGNHTWAREDCNGIDIDAKFGHLTNLVYCDEVDCKASIADDARKSIKLLHNRINIEEYDDTRLASRNGNENKSCGQDDDRIRVVKNVSTASRRRNQSCHGLTRLGTHCQQNNNRKKDDTQSESSKRQSSSKKYSAKQKRLERSQLTVNNLKQMTKQYKHERQSKVHDKVNAWMQRDLRHHTSSRTFDSIGSNHIEDSTSSTTESANKFSYLKKKPKKTKENGVKKRNSSHSIGHGSFIRSPKRDTALKNQKQQNSTVEKGEDTMCSMAEDNTLSRSMSRRQERGVRNFGKKSFMSFVTGEDCTRSSRHNMSKTDKYNSSGSYRQDSKGNKSSKNLRSSSIPKSKPESIDKKQRDQPPKKRKKIIPVVSRKTDYCDCDNTKSQQSPPVKRLTSFHRLIERNSSPTSPRRRSQSMHESKVQNVNVTPRRKMQFVRKPLHINIETKNNTPKAASKQEIFEKRILKERIREASKKRTMDVNRLVKEREEKIEQKIKIIEQIKREGTMPKMSSDRYIQKEYPTKDNEEDQDYFCPRAERNMYGSTYVPIDVNVDIKDLKHSEYFECANKLAAADHKGQMKGEDEEEEELQRWRLKNWKIDYYEYMRGREIYNETDTHDISVETKKRIMGKRPTDNIDSVIHDLSPYKFPQTSIRNLNTERIKQTSPVAYVDHRPRFSKSESSVSEQSMNDGNKQHKEENTKRSKVSVVKRNKVSKSKIVIESNPTTKDTKPKSTRHFSNSVNDEDCIVEQTKHDVTLSGGIQVITQPGLPNNIRSNQFGNQPKGKRLSLTRRVEGVNVVDDKAKHIKVSNSDDTECSGSSLPLQQSLESGAKHNVSQTPGPFNKCKKTREPKLISLSNENSQGYALSKKMDKTLTNHMSLEEIQLLDIKKDIEVKPLVIQDLEIDQDVTDIVLDELENNAAKMTQLNHTGSDNTGEEETSRPFRKLDLLSCRGDLYKMLENDDNSLFVKISNLSDHLKNVSCVYAGSASTDGENKDLKSNIDSFCNLIDEAQNSLKNVGLSCETNQSIKTMPQKACLQDKSTKSESSAKAENCVDNAEGFEELGVGEKDRQCIAETVSRQLSATTPADNMYPTTKTRAIILEAIAAALHKAKQRSIDEKEREKNKSKLDIKQRENAIKRRIDDEIGLLDKREGENSVEKPHHGFTNDKNTIPNNRGKDWENSENITKGSRSNNTDTLKGKQSQRNDSYSKKKIKPNNQPSENQISHKEFSNEGKTYRNTKRDGSKNRLRDTKVYDYNSQSGCVSPRHNKPNVEDKPGQNNIGKTKAVFDKTTEAPKQGKTFVKGKCNDGEIVIVERDNKTHQLRLLNRGRSRRNPYEREFPEFEYDFPATLNCKPKVKKPSSVPETTSSSMPLSSSASSSSASSLCSPSSSMVSSHSINDVHQQLSSSTSQNCDKRNGLKKKTPRYKDTNRLKSTVANTHRCSPETAHYIDIKAPVVKVKSPVKKSKRTLSSPRHHRLMKDNILLGINTSRDNGIEDESPINKLSRALAREFLTQARWNTHHGQQKRSSSRRERTLVSDVERDTSRSRSVSMNDDVNNINSQKNKTMVGAAKLGCVQYQDHSKPERAVSKLVDCSQCHDCSNQGYNHSKKGMKISDCVRGEAMFEDFAQGVTVYGPTIIPKDMLDKRDAMATIEAINKIEGKIVPCVMNKTDGKTVPCEINKDESADTDKINKDADEIPTSDGGLKNIFNALVRIKEQLTPVYKVEREKVDEEEEDEDEDEEEEEKENDEEEEEEVVEVEVVVKEKEIKPIPQKKVGRTKIVEDTTIRDSKKKGKKRPSTSRVFIEDFEKEDEEELVAVDEEEEVVVKEKEIKPIPQKKVGRTKIIEDTTIKDLKKKGKKRPSTIGVFKEDSDLLLKYKQMIKEDDNIWLYDTNDAQEDVDDDDNDDDDDANMLEEQPYDDEEEGDYGEKNELKLQRNDLPINEFQRKRLQRNELERSRIKRWGPQRRGLQQRKEQQTRVLQARELQRMKDLTNPDPEKLDEASDECMANKIEPEDYIEAEDYIDPSIFDNYGLYKEMMQDRKELRNKESKQNLKQVTENKMTNEEAIKSLNKIGVPTMLEKRIREKDDALEMEELGVYMNSVDEMNGLVFVNQKGKDFDQENLSDNETRHKSNLGDSRLTTSPTLDKESNLKKNAGNDVPQSTKETDAGKTKTTQRNDKDSVNKPVQQNDTSSRFEEFDDNDSVRNQIDGDGGRGDHVGGASNGNIDTEKNNATKCDSASASGKEDKVSTKDYENLFGQKDKNDIDALICSEISQCLELVNMSDGKIVKLFSDVEDNLEYSIDDDKVNHDINNGKNETDYEDYSAEDRDGDFSWDDHHQKTSDDDKRSRDEYQEHGNDDDDDDDGDDSSEEDTTCSYCANDDEDEENEDNVENENDEDNKGDDIQSAVSCSSPGLESVEVSGYGDADEEYDENEDDDEDDDGDTDEDDDDDDSNDYDEKATSHNFKEESLQGFQAVQEQDPMTSICEELMHYTGVYSSGMPPDQTLVMDKNCIDLVEQEEAFFQSLDGNVDLCSNSAVKVCNSEELVGDDQNDLLFQKEVSNEADVITREQTEEEEEKEKEDEEEEDEYCSNVGDDDVDNEHLDNDDDEDNNDCDSNQDDDCEDDGDGDEEEDDNQVQEDDDDGKEECDSRDERAV